MTLNGLYQWYKSNLFQNHFWESHVCQKKCKMLGTGGESGKHGPWSCGTSSSGRNSKHWKAYTHGNSDEPNKGNTQSTNRMQHYVTKFRLENQACSFCRNDASVMIWKIARHHLPWWGINNMTRSVHYEYNVFLEHFIFVGSQVLKYCFWWKPSLKLHEKIWLQLKWQ